MSVLDQTASFEHMYAPGRAKSLFGRHRDLTASCDREKQVLDFEWQIVSNQMDKRRNKFRITTAWLWRRLDQLAAQPPIVDPAEFGDRIWSGRPPTRDPRRRRRAPDEPARPKTAAAPRTGRRPRPRVTYATSVRGFDDSTHAGRSSPSAAASPADDALGRPTTGCSDDDDDDDGGGPAGAAKFGMPTSTLRRRSEAGERKVVGEMRVVQLKQSCYFERAALARRVDEFVDEIELYKERHRRDVDGRSESGEEAGCRDVARASGGSAERARAKPGARISGNGSAPRRTTPGSSAGAAPRRRGGDPRQPAKANGAAAKAAARGGDGSGVDVVLGPRPSTTSRADGGRFSLIRGDASRIGRAKSDASPVARAPQTEEDVAKAMMLGAWEAFSADVGPESYRDLVAFAAKHRPKRRPPAKRDPRRGLASAATPIVLAESAVSDFETGIEKQRPLKLGVASPRAEEDQR